MEVSPGLGYTQSFMTLGPSGIKTIGKHCFDRIDSHTQRLNLRDQWVEIDAAAVIEKNNFNVARQ